MDILMKIQNEYLEFSLKEKQVADYVLRYNTEIENMNINEFSKNSRTSNATITRFVKKIGCENYADMKFQINRLLKPKKAETKGIADDVFHYYQTVIENTQNLIDIEKLNEVEGLLKKAKEIIVMGISSSGVTAQILSLRLMRMGLCANSIEDPTWMRMRASIAKKGDLFIALSTSGTTQAVHEALVFAKGSGATIVSITGFSKNPIAELSDLNLYIYSTKFINNQKFVNSQFSMMYLIDVLTTYVLGEVTFLNSMDITRQSINDI